MFEAFTADDLDWRAENTATRWATGYDFPAVGDKCVVLEEFPDAQVPSRATRRYSRFPAAS
jgi:microcin C transport system substrate-binding protein